MAAKPLKFEGCQRMFRLNDGCLEDEEDLENVDFRFFFLDIREY